ncbi:MAG: hypothetical protein EXS36_04120 [Pedosphaera sp.]|nr:hypothetical protein [Pedosphaera sp.]
MTNSSNTRDPERQNKMTGLINRSPVSKTITTAANALCHQGSRLLLGTLALFAPLSAHAVAQVLTFGGNAQHTSLFSTPAQNLNRIKWTVDNDQNISADFAHYGSP